VRGREFFEAVIRENLDLGRPDRVQLVFDRKTSKTTPSQFRTRVIEDGVLPSLHIEYKTSRIKQYFKEGRALRTESTINDPKDFGVNKDLSQLPYLAQIGRQINLRLRATPGCQKARIAMAAPMQITMTASRSRRTRYMRLRHDARPSRGLPAYVGVFSMPVIVLSSTCNDKFDG